MDAVAWAEGLSRTAFAWKFGSDYLVRLVFQLVESADRHRRVAGHCRVHIEPMPGPTQPDLLHIGYARHPAQCLFCLFDKTGINAIQQATPDVADSAP